MNLPLIIRYPLDLSGMDPNNLVLGEEHSVADSNKKAVATTYGPFFTKGLVVRNAATGAPLTKNVDYVAAHLYQEATMRSGQEVCAVIIVKNPTVATISIDYQVVGGEFTAASSVIEQLLIDFESDDRPITWGMIIGVPDQFPPAAHLHDIGDLYGFEFLVEVLEGIRQAILTGDEASHDEIRQVIQELADSLQYATLAEGLEGTITDKVTSVFIVRKMIEAFTPPPPEFDTFGTGDEPWGYWRDQVSNITICFGATPLVAPGTGYRVNFKRRFNNKPIVIGVPLSTTSDTTTAITDYLQAGMGIPEHAVSRDGFYMIGMRQAGTTGNDTVKMHYIAIGRSDSTQPIASNSGSVGTPPPSPEILKQPVWSGSSSSGVTTLQGQTRRVGISFGGNIQGGGTTLYETAVNAWNAAGGSFFYTPYPSAFPDEEYQVMVSATPTNPNQLTNFVSIGKALDVWHDMSTMKALTSTNFSSGFFWSGNGRYGGSLNVSVTVRNKTDITKTATRVFTISQASDAPLPALGGSYTAVFLTSASVQGQFTLNFRNAVQAGLYDTFRLTRGTVGNVEGTNDVTYGTTPSPGTIHPVASQYEVALEMPDASNPGYSNGSGSLLGRYTGGGAENWYSLNQLVTLANMTWIINMVGEDVAYRSFNLVMRHKTDKTKTATYTLNLRRVGANSTVTWSGSTFVLSWPYSGNTHSSYLQTAATPGKGKMSLTASQHTESADFGYLAAGSPFTDADFQAGFFSPVWTIRNPTMSGCTWNITSGHAANTYYPMGSIFRWGGTTANDGQEYYFDLRIRHSATGIVSSRQCRFDVRWQGYWDGT